MKIFILTACLLLSGCASAKWKAGDTVCLKINGAPVRVVWASGPYDPPYYTVQAVDDLNHIYNLHVYETDIQECPKNNT